MSGYDLYVFILCLIVYVMLVSVGIVVISIITKQMIRMIKGGLEDEVIKKEYQKNGQKGKIGAIIEKVISTIFLVVLMLIFALSLYVNLAQNCFSENIPTVNIVRTSSMERKHSKNKYLFTNNLDNQIGAFDLILTYKKPSAEDIKLYDIVVYEVDGVKIVHRVVGIEEPNELHPNERWFRLQGDAIETPDRFPVYYSQILGVYHGERVPFVGSFVLFMQSPAGWMCIILVLMSVIATPILEKKLNKVKHERLMAIGFFDQIAITQTEQNDSVFGKFNKDYISLSFAELLDRAPSDMRERYDNIVELVSRIDGVRLISSFKNRTFKKGSTPIIRFAIRGKTLNAYIGLNPNEYTDSKYIFTDVSSVKKYANYPMRVKVTSNRQARWVNELVLEIVKKENLVLLDKPVLVKEETEKIDFTRLKGRKDNRTFVERLTSAPDKASEFYSVIENKIAELEDYRVIEGKTRTFKVKNTPIVRFAIRGKTLNAYIGLNPNEYTDSKYIFTDVSSVKKYANYPMRVKVTSNRQARWMNELINEIVNKNGLKIKQSSPVLLESDSPFAHLKGKTKSLTFKQKLKKYAIAKDRLNSICQSLLSVDGVRTIESVSGITYKKGNTPVVRFAIRGKTLNAYIGLNPNEYIDSKYIFTDVSSVKKYANYPMRVKVTSNRQVRWTKELIALILKGVGV